MIAGDIKINPETVSIAGAKSVINEIDTVSAIVSLDGEKENFKRNMPVAAYNSKDEIIDGLSITPKEVSADVSIIRGSNTKTVPIKPKISGSPKDGYAIENITIEPSLVDITSNTKVLAEIKSIDTGSLDISGADAAVDKEIPLIFPKDVSSLGNTDKARIKITFKQIDITKEITVSNFKMANDSLKPISFDPAGIKLNIVGPYQKINQILSNDIVVTLNAESGTAGDTIQATINQDDINLPDGISLANFTPLTVRAKIK
jgi:YbbR domain-containing protein